MTKTEDTKSLVTLRIALARIAQVCGPAVEVEIPGADKRIGLEITELTRLARTHERGWNRLAAFIVGHIKGE